MTGCHLVALRGDEAELYARHAAHLRAVVGGLCEAPAPTIEDACAHAWLQLLRRQPDRRTVFAWLATVAKHEAWSLAARERRDLPAHELGDRLDPAADPQAAADAHAQLETVAVVLGPRKSRLVGLKAAGFSYREIVAITGDSYATVNRQLVRARTRLRRLDAA